MHFSRQGWDELPSLQCKRCGEQLSFKLTADTNLHSWGKWGGIPTNKQDSTHKDHCFLLTMHMFPDPHTFLFAFYCSYTEFNLSLVVFSISCTSGRGCDRQFSIYIVCSSTPDSVFMCPLQTCITLSEEFTKTNPQKSWVVLQLGRRNKRASL